MLLCYNRNELDNSLDSIKSEKILEIEDLLCNQSKKIFNFFNIFIENCENNNENNEDIFNKKFLKYNLNLVEEKILNEISFSNDEKEFIEDFNNFQIKNENLNNLSFSLDNQNNENLNLNDQQL
jgi:hypothetical protein